MFVCVNVGQAHVMYTCRSCRCDVKCHMWPLVSFAIINL